MNELNNTAVSSGNYNSVPTALTSNTSVVNLVEGLSITKEADKKNWSDGYLTYTITVDNQTEMPYENTVITDEIDASLIDFVDGTVLINDKAATSRDYNYNQATHTLTINLGTVAQSAEGVVKFSVKKKYNGSFILKNIAYIYNSQKPIGKSNVEQVLIRPERNLGSSFGCSTPFWR